MGVPALDFLSGIMGNQAAADQQYQIAQSMKLQQQMYDQARRDRGPWMDSGNQANYSLTAGLLHGRFDSAYHPLNPQDIANDPGYQFRMAEGQKALERSAAARGGLMGGAFAKGLDRYSQGLASTEYQNAWSRNMGEYQADQQAKQNQFNRLYNASSMGENAAAGLGTLGAGYANSMGSLYGAMGNAQAAGTMAMANGINNAGGDAVNGMMMGMGGGGGMGMGTMGGMGRMGGYGGGYGGGYAPIGGGYDGVAPSASSLYDSNPGNYTLGNMGLNIPGQGGY